MQDVCHRLSSSRSSQPFLMATVAATSSGRALRLPKSPTPRTLRILSRTQSVHLGPAAVPLPMQLPMRTVSRADTYVCDQSFLVAFESVSLQILISRLIAAVLPSRL